VGKQQPSEELTVTTTCECCGHDREAAIAARALREAADAATMCQFYSSETVARWLRARADSLDAGHEVGYRCITCGYVGSEPGHNPGCESHRSLCEAAAGVRLPRSEAWPATLKRCDAIMGQGQCALADAHYGPHALADPADAEGPALTAEDVARARRAVSRFILPSEMAKSLNAVVPRIVARALRVAADSCQPGDAQMIREMADEMDKQP